ncbi:metal-dependent transcriptional regulator [Lacrimispora indolis]|uniref:metal-dependent transcriptional regulator n=1 Tax=Lacrimispora indolis TaxID=69825 RepID=UPI000462B7E5|nr:metal-dependent transcriptional regulator [[Clostridium] methoxybenzovorans]
MKSRESAETYLKAIFLLRQKLGNVRSIDVANDLGISKPSVSVAVKKLSNEGLLTMDRDCNLILTEDGLKYAASIFERHVVIENFLKDILGVGEENAHKDACRLEHIVSPETFSKIKEVYGEKTKSDR